MSTKKEIWRLLEPGVDRFEAGDEVFSLGEWQPLESNFFGVRYREDDVNILRRRITLPEPQGWISVKERMPTKEDANKQGNVLWIDSELSVGVGSWDIHERGWQSHWTTIPDDPEPEKDADEEAFEKFWEKVGSRSWPSNDTLAASKPSQGSSSGPSSASEVSIHTIRSCCSFGVSR